MSAGPQRFRLAETARLIKASLQAGLKVTGVEYDRHSDKVRVLVGEGADIEPRDTSWDDLKDNTQK